MSEEMNVTAQDEYDLSDAGEPQRELLFNITGFETKTTGDEGENVRHVFTLESDELPFPVKVSEWFVHSNETAQRIGRSNLKRLANAASGSPRYSGDGTPVVGAQVIATMYEDDAGFRRIKRPKKAPATV
jgi:hypothetical protein